MVGLIFGVASERSFWAAARWSAPGGCATGRVHGELLHPSGGEGAAEKQAAGIHPGQHVVSDDPHRRHRQMRGSCCRATRPLHRSGAGDRRQRVGERRAAKVFLRVSGHRGRFRWLSMPIVRVVLGRECNQSGFCSGTAALRRDYPQLRLRMLEDWRREEAGRAGDPSPSRRDRIGRRCPAFRRRPRAGIPLGGAGFPGRGMPGARAGLQVPAPHDRLCDVPGGAGEVSVAS